MSNIIQNAIRIIDDDIILLSRSVHDYNEYKEYFVDGGRDYIRYGIPKGKENNVEKLFLYENDTIESFVNKKIWGTKGKDGNDPLKWVKLKDCEEDHLKNIRDYLVKTNVAYIDDITIKTINTILVYRRRNKINNILKNANRKD